jgi:hypothetical protein
MSAAGILVEQLRRTREWTLRLIEDIDGVEWTFQPSPGLQHALWICGHLATAQDTLVFQRGLHKTVLDPAFRAHFPIGGPIRSAAEYDWPSPDLVRLKLDEMQLLTEQAVRGLSDEFLSAPAYGADGKPHPHYSDRLGAISHAARHEAFHAGQLAMLRSLMGKKFLR